MFKTKFVAVFLCLTTVFAMFAGVSFAANSNDEETIVIKDGKVVSGNSDLVDSGFIVIMDESADDETAEETTDEANSGDNNASADQTETLEPEVTTPNKNTMTEREKLNFILNNLDKLYKPVSTGNAASVPTQTPSAINPSIPVQTTSDIPAGTQAPNVADINVSSIGSISLSTDTPNYTGFMSTIGDTNATVDPWLNAPSMVTGETVRSQRTLKHTHTRVKIKVFNNMYFRVPVASGQTLEFIFDPDTSKADGGERGLQRTHPDQSTTALKNDATNNFGRYMFNVAGTMRIIGGLTNDPNYRFYIDGNGKSFVNSVFQGTSNDAVTAPIFYVNGGTLELKNVHIRDNISTTTNGAGSAIHVTNGGKVRLENVVIENCKLTTTTVGTNGVTTQGGAIYITGSGTVSIKNSTIQNCSAGQGGAIAIKDEATSASNYILQIENSTIQNCTANNSFPNATAATYQPNGGGAIYLGTNLGKSVTIKNSKITNCTSSGNGGGIFLSTGTTLIMQGDYYTALTGGEAAKCVISGCTSKFAEQEGKGLPAGGGAIYAESGSTLKMKNTVAEGCCAENGDGGGVFTRGATVDMIGCRLDNNYIKDTSPMSEHLYNKNTLDGTTYFVASALKTGTGIRIQGGTVNMVNTTVLKNQVNRVGSGNSNINNLIMIARGAVYVSGGGIVNMIEVDRSVYNVGMDARVTANYGGGGVYLYGDATYRMYGGSINLNTMYYRNPTYLNTTDPDGNEGYSNGAGVSLQAGEGYTPIFEMYGGAVEASQNSTKGKGGAIGTLAGGKVYIYGGTIGCGGPDSILTNQDNYKNKATRGSAIYMDSKGTNELYIAGGTITNGSQDYGAIYIANGAYFEMEDGTISNNVSLVDGGGIYADPASHIYIEGGIIENNTVATGGHGGGIYANGVSHFFLGNENGGKPIIRGNHGAGSTTTNIQDGGGIYTSNAGVYIHNAEISGNYSVHGAGIYATYNGTSEYEITIKNCDISGNHNGSGIWVNGSVYTVNMTGGKINNNTLTTSGHKFGGAGICATNNVTLNISGSDDTPTEISGNINSSTAIDTSYNYDTAIHGGGIACISRGSASAPYNATLTIEGKVTISNNSVPSGGDPKETVLTGKGCGGGVYMEEGGTLIIREKDGNKPAINNNTAYRGGGIYLDSVYTSGASNQKASTLNISGATFTGNVSNEYRFVLADGDSSNPRALGGGAICVYHNVATTIEKATFTSNKASMESGTGGGAISAVDLNGTLTIKDCIFTNNYVAAKGALYTADSSVTGDGGAVFCRNVTIVNLTDCEMTGNKAQQGGGLYVIRDSYYCTDESRGTVVNLNGCEVNNNSDGGLFFQRNADTTTTPRALTVNIGTTTIKQNNIGKHVSHRFGGAGITCVNGITLTLNSGTLIDNNTNNVERITEKPAEIANIEEIDTAASGGGIAMIRKGTGAHLTCGTLTVNGGVTISNNTAKYGDGGGIYIEDETGTLIILSSASKSVTVSGNTAGNEDLSYTEEENKSNDNLPGGNGGGIYAGLGSKIRITGNASCPVIISGNHAIGGSTGFASSGHGGGGIFLNKNTDTDGTAVKLTYVDVLTNTSELNSGDGGGVFCWNTALQLTECRIIENEALSVLSNGDGSGKGAGLLFYHTSNPGVYTLSVDKCLFEGNQTSSWGAGAHLVNKTVSTIKNSVFKGNKANQGGGLHLYNERSIGGQVTLENVYIGSNIAAQDAGGGLFALGYKVIMKDCYIGWLPDDNGGKIAAGNTTGYSGGGAYFWGSELELTGHLDVSNNTAGSSGGGLFFRVWIESNAVLPLSIPEFNGVVITNNTAKNNGGGIYVYNYTSMATANNNTIYNDNEVGKSLRFKGCTVTGNTATTGNGGGVYAKDIALLINNSSGGASVTGSSLWNNNKAGSDGGAVWVTKSSSLSLPDNEVSMFKISGTEFAGNTSGVNGGAVAIEGAPGYITTSLFYNNTAAGGHGGAIYYHGDKTKEDSLFQLAINGVGTDVDINDNSLDAALKGNKALMGYGGGMYVSGCNKLISVRGGYNYGQAVRGGGLFFTDCEEVNITNDANAFIDPYANINNSGINLSTTQVMVSTNKAFGNGIFDGNGGGIYADCDATFTNVKLQYNTSEFDGAGICVADNHTVTMNGFNYIRWNTSDHYGGGVIVRGGGTLDIVGTQALNTEIYGNKLTSHCGGAGIHVASGATFNMDYGKIYENGRNARSSATPNVMGAINANGHGGGIDITGGNVTINNVVITDNAAGISGGGVRLSGGSFTATNCVIKGNVANSGNGGGVYVVGSSSTATVNGTYIIGNNAGGSMSGDTTMAASGDVIGVGGGVAVFDGGIFIQKNSGAIYNNTAFVGAADVFANGLSTTKLTVLAPNAMDTAGGTKLGIDIPAFEREGVTEGKWWEDYMNEDLSYTSGLNGSVPPAYRYADSPVSIRAYTSSTEGTQVSGGSYINTDGEFVSIIFDVQKYNVGTIVITAPSGENVENQRFVFEIKGDVEKGEDFTITLSLLGGQSVTIPELLPGTYTITQKTDWSWRFDYEDVTITATQGVAGENKGEGVVEVTIAGTLRDETHTVVYDNDKTMEQWLDHNSVGVTNKASPQPVNVAFDMAESKKAYIL